MYFLPGVELRKVGSMGKAGEERALDLKLKVLGSVPSHALEFFCTYSHTLTQASPLSLYMTAMSSPSGMVGWSSRKAPWR